MEYYFLNIFIYDNSLSHRCKLEKIIRNYAESNNIELGIVVSTTQSNNILNLSQTGSGLYFLNIDNLEKEMDGIKYGLNIRNKDLDNSIVFLTEHNIFMTGRSDLGERSLKSHIIVMSFLAKDSVQYENEIYESIAAHIRKISLSFLI